MTSRTYALGLVLLSCLLLMLGFQNCSQQGALALSADQSNTGSGDPMNPTGPGGPPLNSSDYKLQLDAGNYVCSPFGNVTVASEKSGLKCELRYVSANSTLSAGDKNNIKSVEYFDQTSVRKDIFVAKPEPVYLNNVYVPTRQFTGGFDLSDGSYLTDDKGNKLVEYFALKMDSVLKLDAADAEGKYELATISDDGTVVQIYENGAWVDVIQNDGAHSAKMGCMARQITMTKQSRIPIRIYYNQGPQTEIANVLVWKRVDESQLIDIHSYCGKSSSTDFWNPANNSAAGSFITGVYNLGWKVVAPANFVLPDNEVNPCAFSNYAVIHDLTLLGAFDNKQRLQLDLDEAASAQVNLYELGSGGAKTLIANFSYQADVRQTIFLSLDKDKTYSLEIILTLTNKNLKVRKEYKLQFVPK